MCWHSAYPHQPYVDTLYVIYHHANADQTFGAKLNFVGLRNEIPELVWSHRPSAINMPHLWIFNNYCPAFSHKTTYSGRKFAILIIAGKQKWAKATKVNTKQILIVIVNFDWCEDDLPTAMQGICGMLLYLTHVGVIVSISVRINKWLSGMFSSCSQPIKANKIISCRTRDSQHPIRIFSNKEMTTNMTSTHVRRIGNSRFSTFSNNRSNKKTTTSDLPISTHVCHPYELIVNCKFPLHGVRNFRFPNNIQSKQQQ